MARSPRAILDIMIRRATRRPSRVLRQMPPPPGSEHGVRQWDSLIIPGGLPYECMYRVINALVLVHWPVAIDHDSPRKASDREPNPTGTAGPWLTASAIICAPPRIFLV